MKEESFPGFADMEENLEVEGNQAVDQGGKLELEDSDSVMSGQDQQVELTLPTSGMKEIVSNPAKLSLTPDMRFKDWASFEDHFNAWKAQNFTHTRKNDSKPNKRENANTHKYSHLEINCVHYGLPRMKTTKFIRKKQSYMARGCMFEIGIKLDPTTNYYFFNKFHIDHKNHDVSAESYMSHPMGRRLSDKEVEKYVSDYLINMRVSKKVLKERIYADTGKRVTSNDLQNWKVRLKKASMTLSELEVEKYVGDYMMNLKVSKNKLEERIFAETGKRVTSKQLEDFQLQLDKKRSMEVASTCMETSNFEWVKPEEGDIYDLQTDMVVSDYGNPDIDLIFQEQHTESQPEHKVDHISPNQTKIELTPDLRFKDWASFEDHFDTWKAQNFTHTRKSDSKPNKRENADTHRYAYVEINCVHYGKPRICKEGPRQRKLQSYMAKGCTFELLVKLDYKTNEYLFRKFNIAHKNHEVSEKAYISHPNRRKLNDPEVEKYVSNYIVGLKMPKDAVQEQIYKETGKLVTWKDLDNYKKKLLSRRNGKLKTMQRVDPW